MNHKASFLIVLAISLGFVATVSIAMAQGPRPSTSPRTAAVTSTTFTYQGELKNNSVPVNGTCDLLFTLYDASTAGNAIGNPVTSTVAVANGLFTAGLDFGANAFDGSQRWLDTQVRCPAGSGLYTSMPARQALTATPYALSLMPGAVISGTAQYALTAFSENLAAIRGENTGSGYGVMGEGSNTGVYAHNTSGGGTAYLGSSCCAADLYGAVNIQGNLFVSGSKSGFIVDHAKNADRQSLSVGDVVAVVGSTSPLVGNIPVALVVKANSAYQTGVVGVVSEHVTPGDHLSYDGKPITPGEYLSVVTLGMFHAIQVDAGFGKIYAGDLLVASPHAGYAMKATDRTQAIGAIIGKALGDLDSGVGTVPVLVTLQ